MSSKDCEYCFGTGIDHGGCEHDIEIAKMSSIVEKMSAGLEAAAAEILLLRETLEYEQTENKKLREALWQIAAGALPASGDSTTRVEFLRSKAREALT
jgi:hypothetical protein